MPDETYWESLFNIDLIVRWLGLNELEGPVIEIGCGYGTFTVPVARACGLDVYAFDIDPSMIEIAERNVHNAGLMNVKCFQRDVVSNGTGMESDSAALVLLFNILHFKERRILLEEAERVLATGGVVSIIHWRKDIRTPRGPEVSSRPDEQVILDSVSGLDLTYRGDSRILEPYHWGMKLIKTRNQIELS